MATGGGWKSKKEAEEEFASYLMEKIDVPVQFSVFEDNCITIKKDETNGDAKELTKFWEQILESTFQKDEKSKSTYSHKGDPIRCILWESTGTVRFFGEKAKNWLQKNYKDMLDKYDENNLNLRLANLSLNSTRKEQTLKDILTSLSSTQLKCGRDVVYPIWTQLLEKWSSSRDTKVYAASPFWDEIRLKFVVDLVMNRNGIIGEIFAREKCFGSTTLTEMKKEIKQRYNADDHKRIEDDVFENIKKPQKYFHCKFIAAVIKDTHAEVLITSANFTRNHFGIKNLESVVFVEIKARDFQERFLDPMLSL